jgi:hypothetical protein
LDLLEPTPIVALNDLIASGQPIANCGVYVTLRPEVTMSIPGDTGEWVTACDGARLAGLTVKNVMKLGRLGAVSVKRIPGCRPRYHKGELEAINQDFTFPRKYTSPAEEQPGDENRPIATP